MIKKIYQYLIPIFVIIYLAVFLAGCDKQNESEQMQSSFDTFMNDLFLQEVQSDTLSLNYSLAEPENYGIRYDEITLGEYSVNEMVKGLSLSENHLVRLKSFDYSQLTSKQKLTYDIVKNYIEQDLSLGNYLHYGECLGPTTGVQAQLPILLAEYSFYDREDIDRYLELLSCVYDYFEDIAQFEREKSERGLFMDDRIADRIIAQCQAFIDTPEDNYLIEYFNDKISNYKGLTRKEIAFYQKENKDAILTKVIPAYKMLINVLQDLKGTGTNEAGLYYYPNGRTFYEALAKYKTGSSKNIEEMIEMLEKAIEKGILDITTLSLTDSSIMDKYTNFTSFPITDPEQILTDLKDDMKKDFPKPTNVNCNIKYVHDSLSDYLSPAMYLMPPMDHYENNNIYINGSDADTLAMIYTTVAHEGYPGHLYQCVYFRSQNPAPIRNAMNFTGYDEGWATYVEMYSYHLSGIDENLAKLLEANNIVILCMYARADIGIHYEGWTKDDTVAYVMHFIDDEKISESIYHVLLEEPGIYLPYAIGYLEIMELRQKAESSLGEKFIAKDFHRFLLEIGPAQFHIIDRYLEVWVDQK